MAVFSNLARKVSKLPVPLYGVSLISERGDLTAEVPMATGNGYPGDVVHAVASNGSPVVVTVAADGLFPRACGNKPVADFWNVATDGNVDVDSSLVGNTNPDTPYNVVVCRHGAAWLHPNALEVVTAV